MTQFFGKYRGKVVNNLDPDNLGRVKVIVPAVLGAEVERWAMPCVPYAGPGVGLLLIPPVSASVWVEFEGGDAAKPIWTGCFWEAEHGLSDTPAKKVLKTEQITLVIDDDSPDGDGSVTLALGSLGVPSTSIRIDESIKLSVQSNTSRVEISPGNIRLRHVGSEVEIGSDFVKCKAGSSSLGLATTWTWPPSP
jgi:hypothetical protein